MKTVKVRIAVAVDPDGKWSAYGCPGADETDMDIAVDAVAPGEARYWVTAELPIPAEIDVAGAVEACDDAPPA